MQVSTVAPKFEAEINIKFESKEELMWFLMRLNVSSRTVMDEGKGGIEGLVAHINCSQDTFELFTKVRDLVELHCH